MFPPSFRTTTVLNTFTTFDAPSRDVWVEHALRMRSVVRHLYDSRAVHIRRKRVHGRSKYDSYLTNRKQHVVVGGESSLDTPVLSGVPQGSALGPLLFLVYIDDVSDVLLSDRSTLNIYADDMLLYKPVKSIEDIHHLQMDIDCISGWVDCNNSTLNSNKYKTMVISRKQNSVKPHAEFTLNSSPLEQVETFKYLGLILSSDLSCMVFTY